MLKDVIVVINAIITISENEMVLQLISLQRDFLSLEKKNIYYTIDIFQVLDMTGKNIQNIFLEDLLKEQWGVVKVYLKKIVT